MDTLNDKDFYKIIKKESEEYSPEIQLSEGFPYFCLKIFWDLPKDTIEEALCGLKVNDESIDAFYVDEENKEIHFIQCKSSESPTKSKPLKKAWLSYLNEIDTKLKNNDFIDNHQNQRIKEIAKQFIISSSKGYKTKKHFFHLGHCGNQDTLKYYDNKIIYYDQKKIKDEYLEYLSKLDRTEPESIEVQLSFDVIEPAISTKHKTFVSIITGDEIINLRKKYRYKLFDKNLRFGLGQNKINKGITTTALQEPKNFYFFNNGITITSKGFKYKNTNSKLRIDFPQIINGAQTVNAIYSAFKEKENKLTRAGEKDSTTKAKDAFKDIKILFRIIQDSEKGGKKISPFEEKVIRYNNTQNPIKETDFYSNHPEQIKLQKLFAEHGYFYEIKRGDRKYLDNGKEEHCLLKKKKRDFAFWNEKLDIEKLASFWMAYRIDPTVDKVQKANIFGYAKDKNYDLLFKEKDFGNNDIKEMILAFNLFNIIASQTEIYGSAIKKGQIVTKIAKIKEGETENFKNIQQIIQGSLFLGEIVKKEFQNMQTFFKNKQNLLTNIKNYQFFSQGKYLTLAIFSLIINECGYLKQLIETDLFKKEDFLKNNLVACWLKKILDDLVKEKFTEFSKDTGSSIKNFYRKNSTWENIKHTFNNLKYKYDKDFKDIFPITL